MSQRAGTGSSRRSYSTLLALGADNILFAVDWPFEPNTTGIHFLNQLPISDSDREKIAHLNAERILRM